MAGDHGIHPAEAIVTVPDLVAAQLVQHLHAELVDVDQAVEDRDEVRDEDRDEVLDETPAPAASPAPRRRRPSKRVQARAEGAEPDPAEWSADAGQE